MEYIGISEDRLHHILGVARRCYQISKEEGFDEDFCRRMFGIGFFHDIGYEFSENQSEHANISSELFRLLVKDPCIFGDDELEYENRKPDTKAYETIRDHGSYTELLTNEWRILNVADMTVDSKGNIVDVMQRLEDIKNRYGEYSNQYLTACDLAIQIGLIEKNSNESV